MLELTLAEFAHATAQTHSDRTVLVFGDRETNASQLDLRANQVANGLWGLDLVDQERVAILDHSSDQFYEIWTYLRQLEDHYLQCCSHTQQLADKGNGETSIQRVRANLRADGNVWPDLGIA